jgi:hypothetical protein
MTKLTIVLLVLVLAIAAAAQGTQPQQPAGAAPQAPAAGAAPAAQPAAPQQKKEIKDPAEYNAYLNALNQTDPNAKALALEGFLQSYPNSVMKEDALELLMAAYEQANNPAKMSEAANRLLQVNPNNLRALALLAFSDRNKAETATNPQQGQQALAEGAQYAERGLAALQTAQKPEGMSDEDFQKLKTQTAIIFNGVSGLAALQAKNYPLAQQRLRAAVQGNPANLRDVYPLALSYLQAQPPDYPDGLWFIARAANLAAGTPAQAQIARFGHAQYVKYHGGEDGWNELLQTAASNPLPPEGFAIKAAPTPAEQAAKLVETKPVKDMSFDEIQLVLTSGNQQAAESVWNQIKDKPIALEGKLISATANQLSIAASAEDIEKNQADVTVVMTAPIPARLAPKPGAPIQFEATPTEYSANPFMVTMNKGALIGKATAPAPAPARKAPVRRRPS